MSMIKLNLVCFVFERSLQCCVKLFPVFAKIMFREEKVWPNMKSLMSLSKAERGYFVANFGCSPISKLTGKQLNVT